MISRSTHLGDGSVLVRTADSDVSEKCEKKQKYFVLRELIRHLNANI